MIRLQIVEKDKLKRKLLAYYLDNKEDIEIVSECGTCDKALQQADESRPDVILVDTGVPDGDLLRTSESLNSKHPDTSIVVISPLRFDVMIRKLQKSGVKGFVSSDDNPESLVDAILTVDREDTYMSRSVAQHLALASSPAGNDALPGNLSDREKEILVLLSSGKSVQEIADMLYLSPKTVFSHRKRIFEKTGSGNLVDLVFWALRNKLMQVD